jgi:hypothetical protein
MAAVFLAIVILAGAAVVGRLGGPVDAVPVAFFGLWAALLVWVLGRVAAGEAKDADDVGDVGDPVPVPAPALEREPETPLPI